jgi:hypothetical protein
MHRKGSMIPTVGLQDFVPEEWHCVDLGFMDQRR